jgi:hypothetical protein
VQSPANNGQIRQAAHALRDGIAEILIVKNSIRFPKRALDSCAVPCLIYPPAKIRCFDQPLPYSLTVALALLINLPVLPRRIDSAKLNLNPQQNLKGGNDGTLEPDDT